MARQRTKKPRNSSATKSKTNYRKEESSDKKVPEKLENTGSRDPRDVGKDEVDAPKGNNDPEWYARDPQLLMDAASFPYAYPLGDKVVLSGGKPSIPHTAGSITDLFKWGQYVDEDAPALPGICSLAIFPTIGNSQDIKDPANVCANAFYTHLRYANSGRKNYDPADVMMYALTFSEIYSFVNWCIRLYRYAFMYSQRNKYICRELIKANYVDPDNLVQNLANFRYWINAYINKVSAFAVPSTITLFYRRAMMYAAFYIENPDGNIKDQLYQFVPDAFMRFKLDDLGAGMLTPRFVRPNGFPSSFMTWNDVATIGNDLLGDITGDEDFGLISGDILKAYGTNIIGLNPISEDGTILPVFDEYVLSQMRNATMVYNVNRMPGSANRYELDATRKVYAGDIWQDDKGNVRCTNVSASAATIGLLCAMDKILTTRNPTPGPADTIEGSRLMVGMKSHWEETTAGSRGILLTTGSEICVNIFYSQINNAGHSSTGTILIPGFPAMLLDSNTSTTDLFNYISALAMKSMFHWDPLAYLINVHTTGTAPNTTTFIDAIRCVSNVDNYTIVGSMELDKLHQAALLSLFYVPGIAKVIGMAN